MALSARIKSDTFKLQSDSLKLDNVNWSELFTKIDVENIVNFQLEIKETTKKTPAFMRNRVEKLRTNDFALIKAFEGAQTALKLFKELLLMKASSYMLTL
jgi:hypothetical protein